MISRPHRDHTSTAFSDNYDRDDCATMRHSATLRPLEDYTNKYKLRVVARVCSAD